ncbi:carboxylesterase family protein [Nocardia sp. NPDC051990]|uniref:carboxylesterase family protein n=1 Tax=Nocardia sp. NPDC051990 TaxID=3155285 RepID=UPI00344744F2
MSDETIAQPPQGPIAGCRSADGLLRFRGISYASARRFARPIPVSPHRDVLPAMAPGPICPQLPSRLEAVMGPPPDEPAHSEDCLNLTITTPGRTGRRPVMVWFHGGGYTSGGGSLEWYDGGRLALAGDVVVVSVNYRLGAFGWLVLDGVSEGNLGAADQRVALEWVQANIAAFGGDPENVTAFGQSAGAQSIVNLLGRKDSRHLARRAILQSTPGAALNYTHAQALRHGELFATFLRDDPISAPADRILAAHRATAHAVAAATGNPVLPPFAPVVGVPPLDGPPADGYPDLLVGHTRDEATAFIPRDNPARPTTEESDLTDSLFAATSRGLAAAAAESGSAVFTYRFDWAPPDSRFGAAHCVELPFLLGTPASWRNSPMLGAATWAEIESLGATMRRAWTGFAATGHPGKDWPAYSPEHGIGMVFRR